MIDRSVSDFLNLGGFGGAMSRAIPARALDTNFQPAGVANGRPCLVMVTLSLQTTNNGDSCQVEARCDRATPPTTAVARTFIVQAGANALNTPATLIILVQPGEVLRLVKSGVGTATIQLCTEVTL